MSHRTNYVPQLAVSAANLELSVRQISSTIPNPTHRKVRTLDPQTDPSHNPLELSTTNHKPPGTTYARYFT